MISLILPADKAISADDTGMWSVQAFGVTANGTTDNTVAIQKALDEAAQAGGRVLLSPGRYLVSGSLRIPPGVTLQGTTDSPVWSEPLKGSVILATGGRDREDAPALFELGHSSTVRGITVWYPEQKPTEIHPYPWTFHLEGHDNTVENVTLINSYNGIRIGPGNNVRHRIRSVVGCVLRRGIFVDFCTDIGRIENVQFHCHWWSAKAVGGDWKPVHEFMWKNLEAFIFGRTDWEYVNNTFVYPVNIGYRFIATTNGMANGQFSGIGADEAQVCVKVDAIQPMGLLISNGQFVCMHGEVRVPVLVEKTCRGSVRLVNCAFWGPNRQCVISHSSSFVSLSDCYLSSTGRTKNPGVSLIEADGGKLQVRGCSFGSDEPAIALKTGLQHAIITENNGVVRLEIANEIGEKAVIANNESTENRSGK
ncbi:MAG TPA: glycosyl hydrolase family 28-related protein [Candidatus Paceibacterota bacterium]|nr:glycosyl hydrolase family 28-related protein [Candidatus Paceibacterota bacterium]